MVAALVLHFKLWACNIIVMRALESCESVFWVSIMSSMNGPIYRTAILSTHVKFGYPERKGNVFAFALRFLD